MTWCSSCSTGRTVGALGAVLSAMSKPDRRLGLQRHWRLRPWVGARGLPTVRWQVENNPWRQERLREHWPGSWSYEPMSEQTQMDLNESTSSAARLPLHRPFRGGKACRSGWRTELSMV